MKQRLGQGYLMTNVKSMDFQYTYFLWFEDEQGRKVYPTQDLPASLDVYAADYYDRVLALVRKESGIKTLRCTEFFAVHLAVVPFHVIVEQVSDLHSYLRDGLNQ